MRPAAAAPAEIAHGPRVLVVDDEAQMRLAMSRVLARAGYSVEEARDGEEALEKLKSRAFAVVVTDVRMPKLDGLAFLGHARRTAPSTEIIMITAYGTVESAVEAVRRGARDYILKPFPPQVLERAVAAATGRASADAVAAEAAAPPGAAAGAGGARATDAGASGDGAALPSVGPGPDGVDQDRADPASRGPHVSRGATGAEKPFLTADPAMRAMLERAERAAASEATILIQAESGAGKELLARFIHRASPRRGGPFVALNCAAFPHELLESELFGHARGAFTGAVRERRGLFEAAGGGTVLLDEIAETSPALQAKLLRVLQEREVLRLGEESPRPIDVRVIASTNRDLAAAVREGRFREDLYFRISVIPVRIPPLRERPEDIPLLVEHFCRIHGRGRGGFRIARPALAALKARPWPGNVRELENVVHRAVVLANGPELVTADLFPEDSGDTPPAGPGGDGSGIEGTGAGHGRESMALRGTGAAAPAAADRDGGRRTWAGATIAQAERVLIEQALERTGGNRTRAAELVGISIRTLRNKLREYRLAEGRQNLPTDS